MAGVTPRRRVVIAALFFIGGCLGLHILSSTGFFPLDALRNLAIPTYPGSSFFPSKEFKCVDVQPSPQGGNQTAPCPKVFKYPLPAEWDKFMILGDRGHADKAFPNPWGEYLWPGKLGYHATKHKSGASIFENLLETYGDLCRTTNPAEADLFFIPWYRDYFCGLKPCNKKSKEREEEAKMFDHIQNYTNVEFGVNYFQRYQGRDHLLLVPSEAATALVPKDLKWFRGNYRYLISTSTGYGSARDFPLPTLVRYEVGMRADQIPWIFNPAKRKRLLFMSFGTPYGIRRGLMAQCEAVGNDVCLNVDANRNRMFKANPSDSTKTSTHEPTPAFTFREIVTGMQESVFCANVGGDFCFRRAFFDSIALGCISIVFSHCPLEYHGSFIDMNNAAILVPKSLAARGLIEYLKAIPEYEIRRRQLFIAANAHRIQFSRINSRADYDALSTPLKALVHGDAFFTVLRVSKETKDNSLKCDFEMKGQYQPRFKVCCEAKPGCDPLQIVAMGIINHCETKGSPPCYFNSGEMHELIPFNRQVDPLNWGDFLRGPIPFGAWNESSPYTMAADW